MTDEDDSTPGSQDTSHPHFYKTEFKIVKIKTFKKCVSNKATFSQASNYNEIKIPESQMHTNQLLVNYKNKSQPHFQWHTEQGKVWPQPMV